MGLHQRAEHKNATVVMKRGLKEKEEKKKKKTERNGKSWCNPVCSYGCPRIRLEKKQKWELRQFGCHGDGLQLRERGKER